MTRLPTIVAVSLPPAALAVAGCSEEPIIEPIERTPVVYMDLTQKSHVLHNLVTAYNAKNALKVNELVDTTSGVYTFESTAALVRDVRLWSSAPHRNFGWIVIGEETIPQTAKKIASRESADPLSRPRLQVTYRMRGRP